MFGVDTATTPDTLYTYYITLETGAVTSVGNGQLTADTTSIDGSNQCAVKRGTIASGNFTLLFEDRTVVVNESTGAIVSDDASVNVTNGEAPGNYFTEDGVYSVSCIGIATGYLTITKSGQTYTYPVLYLHKRKQEDSKRPQVSITTN